jgi:hypothetical protein
MFLFYKTSYLNEEVKIVLRAFPFSKGSMVKVVCTTLAVMTFVRTILDLLLLLLPSTALVFGDKLKATTNLITLALLVDKVCIKNKRDQCNRVGFVEHLIRT